MPLRAFFRSKPKSENFYALDDDTLNENRVGVGLAPREIQMNKEIGLKLRVQFELL